MPRGLPALSTLKGRRHVVEIAQFANMGTRKLEIELAIARTRQFGRAKCGDAKREGLRRLLNSSRAAHDRVFLITAASRHCFAAIEPFH
jgi:hypothetical protein